MYTQLCNERIQTLLRFDRLTSCSRFRKWKAVTKPEMKGFFSAVINMGIINLSDIESHWKTSWVSEVKCSCHEINSKKYSECCMSATLIPAGLQRRLTRSSSCCSCYFQSSGSTITSKNLAIDETMVGFHGCFGAKQNAPKNGASRHSTWLIPRMGTFLTP